MLKIFHISKNDRELSPEEKIESGREASQSIREYMNGGIFKHPTGALRDSIIAYVVGEYLYVASDKDYADSQNDGLQSHVMWYLAGKTVPINTPSGTIYRKATIKSFLEGKWKHPGYPGKRYVEEGLHKFAMREQVDIRRKDGSSV